MAINATFQPSGPTVLVGATAVQVPGSGSGYVQSVRVKCVNATRQYLTWGTSNAVTAAGGPVDGTPSANTIGQEGGNIETFSFPSNAWFIASAAASFEVTPGEGM